MPPFLIEVGFCIYDICISIVVVNGCYTGKISTDANRKIRSDELGILYPDIPIHPSSENKNICNASNSHVVLIRVQSIISNANFIFFR